MAPGDHSECSKDTGVAPFATPDDDVIDIKPQLRIATDKVTWHLTLSGGLRCCARTDGGRSPVRW